MPTSGFSHSHLIHHIPDTSPSNAISKNGSIFLKRQMSSSIFKNTLHQTASYSWIPCMHKSTFFNSGLNSVEGSLLKESGMILKGTDVQLWLFITQRLLGIWQVCRDGESLRMNATRKSSAHTGPPMEPANQESGWLGRTGFPRVPCDRKG